MPSSEPAADDDDADCFGITVVVPYCSFEAEVSRKAIPRTIAELERAITEAGDLDEIDDRVAMAMGNVLASARQLADGQIGQETAVAEIAYSLIYMFVQQSSLADCMQMRGLTACYLPNEDGYRVHAYPDSASYESAVAEARRQVAYWQALCVERATAELADPRSKPTIH